MAVFFNNTLFVSAAQPSVAERLHSISQHLKNLRYEEALYEASQTESILRQISSFDTLALADCLRMEATALRKLKKSEMSWSKLIVAQQLLQQSRSARKYDVWVSVLNQMGLITNSKGNYREAMGYYDSIFDFNRRGWVRRREAIAEAYLNKTNSLDYLAEYNQAVALQQEGIVYCEQFLDKNHPKIADLWNNMGGIRRRQGQLQAAQVCYQNALKVFVFNFGTNHPESYFFFNNLGNVYFASGNIEQARDYFQKGWDSYLLHHSANEPPADIFFVNMANIQLKEGAYQWALDYFQKALTIRKNNYGNDHPTTATSYNYVAGVLTLQKKYKEAIALYQKALAIYQKYELEAQPEIADCYDNLGVTYSALGDDAQALSFLKKGLQLSTQIYGSEHYRNPMAWQNIGDVYVHQRQWKKAEQAYQEAIRIYQVNFGDVHPDLAQAYTSLAAGYLAQGQLVAAESCCQKAFKALATNETKPNFERCQSPLQLLHTYEVAAKTASKVELTKSTERYRHAVQLFDYIQNQYLDDESRRSLGQRHYALFEQAIEVFLQQYQQTQQKKWLHEAAFLAEKSKYTQLLRTMRYSAILKMTGVDYSTQQQLSEINALIVQYQQQRTEALVAKTSTQSFDDKLFELRQKKQQIHRQLALKSPQTQALLTNAALTSPVQLIKQILPPQKTLIEYVWGDNHLIGFVYLGDKIYFFSTSIDSTLLRHLYAYQQLISKPPSGKEADLQELAVLSHKLYQQILQPALVFLNKEIHQLTIVPDGPLNYLPFETLLTHLPKNLRDFGSLPYLKNNYLVSYAPSVNLLSEQLKQHSQPAFKTWGGFAASYPAKGWQLPQSGLRLYPLGKNQNEITQTAVLTAGTAFVGTKATIENYKQYASDFRLLHLAMHTLINDQNPELSSFVFSPTHLHEYLLPTQDLYQIPLKADMVVLSACQTGIGQWQQGEGVFSLARAFIFAGAKSQVVSLWQIPDAATAQIITFFYQNLHRGLPKDQALRQAKKQYMSHLSAAELAHPYYWAGFVLQGNPSTVSFERHFPIEWVIWIGGCLVCVSLLVFLGRIPLPQSVQS
ncbi:MAG: CHAT domain-containing tetratricopeptide repeat protein [Runella sp.]